MSDSTRSRPPQGQVAYEDVDDLIHTATRLMQKDAAPETLTTEDLMTLNAKVDSERTFDVRLEGWEQFHSPVDRIVSIEAFEHFGFEHYVDDHMRNIPDHYHAHARPKGGFFGHHLRAVAKPLTRGRTTQVWETTITDEQSRIVATGRLRLLVVRNDQIP